MNKSVIRQLLAFRGQLCKVISVNCLSTSPRYDSDKSYKLVVIGGGAGGCATAAKFARKLGRGKVAVIEPSDSHYYQPLWSLVGGGMEKLEDSRRPMKEVLPADADWVQQKVITFKPDQNKIVTSDGSVISYEHLVVAMGLQLKYDQIKGLPEAFETPGVCSNYSHLYVNKTWQNLSAFKGGNAVFTQPSCPVKCAGAPQKIMYIFHDFQRKNGRLDQTKISFNSGLGLLFSAKHYADAFHKLAEGRGIQVNLKRNLVEVKPDTKEAVFQSMENPEQMTVLPYDFLHITPPMAAPDELRASPLVDSAGFLDINKDTLQHKTYKNIFGIGDCTNLPTSKTAAAVAGQLGTLKKNLSDHIEGKTDLTNTYDGYTSCPMVTGYKTCIVAEFDYSTNPKETFPVDQRKERTSMFIVKRYFLPAIYWNFMLKGRWNGPKFFRKVMSLGMK